MARGNPAKLPASFYRRRDVTTVARDLLGKQLCSRIDGEVCRLFITETEAYAGVSDKASHAFGGLRTKRTEPLYAPGGLAYVYLCYGIHRLFNVVTGAAGEPHAVLVRAGVAGQGADVMLRRRRRASAGRDLLNGPGKLAQALAISTTHSGISLAGDTLWIEDAGIDIPPDAISTGPRIGVDYAGADAALPYRYLVDLIGVGPMQFSDIQEETV
ncbi:MAG: DNA-3-methyladenine glycosylase [Woeseiaceae bacterium]|nr:DNA-3-methyladenine glycosylase [Woeseiaceae bacterium]